MNKLVRAFILFLAGTGSASAHHGLDNYNTTQLIELKGRVVDFRLLDPHSILVVETENADGTRSTWEIEGGSGSGIVKAGISQEFLRSGPAVTIKAFQTKDGACTPRCRAAGEDFNFEPN